METVTIKASTLQENLKAGLSLVSRAVASRATLPILGNVLLAAEPEGKIRLEATNLEIGVVAWIGAKVEQPGAITVPARLLSDLVNSFPPERVDLSLAEESQTLNVKCGRLESNLKGIAAEDFPVVPKFGGGGVEIPGVKLLTLIDQVVFAAAKDEARPILTGVQVKLEEDKITMAAADGFRLSVASQNGLAGLDTEQVIIPARALAELGKIVKEDELVTVVIQPARRQILFHTADWDLTSQLIEGKFPDFNQIIPKSHTTRTVVDTAAFLKAVKVSSLFARDSANIVKLAIQPGKVTLFATSAELGDNVAELDASVDGEALEIAFNCKYLADALNVMDAAQVVIETSVASSPGLFKPVGDERFSHVIMPMHISR